MRVSNLTMVGQPNKGHPMGVGHPTAEGLQPHDDWPTQRLLASSQAGGTSLAPEGGAGGGAPHPAPPPGVLRGHSLRPPHLGLSQKPPGASWAPGGGAGRAEGRRLLEEAPGAAPAPPEEDSGPFLQGQGQDGPMGRCHLGKGAWPPLRELPRGGRATSACPCSVGELPLAGLVPGPAYLRAGTCHWLGALQAPPTPKMGPCHWPGCS